jgi:tetratricopeptide (TPR) repeat protein
MIGYNSREIFQDATYDVQTQQLSSPERSIETHVYRNGKIVATVRCFTSADAPIDSIEERMSQQHEETCGKVREGTYELVFLWISRGIIAFESQDYLQSLECFESVLAIEETHDEANAYLEKMQASLKEDAQSRRRVLEGYQRQIEELESSGRIMEASRKKAILSRICETPPTSAKRPAAEKRSEAGRAKPAEKQRPKPTEVRRPAYVTFLENSLQKTRESLLPWIRERLVPAIREGVPGRIRGKWVHAIRETLVPKVRDTLIPKLRANLFSKYALVTCSTVMLAVLSGLIASDYQRKLDPAYQSNLGREYLEENRIPQARTLFYGMLKQDPESKEAIDGFWQTFLREGDYPKAEELLKALLEDQDSSPQVYFHLGEANRLSSRHAEAIPYYEEAAKRGFPEVPCKIGMGLCLLGQNHVQAAIDLWEGLLQGGSEDFRVEYCLGTAYQANGRLGRASIHYSKALQKRPESGPIYRALGDCLHGLHQQEKAEGLWKKAALLEATAGGGGEGCPGPRQSADGSPRTSPGNCFPFPLT